MSTGADYMAKLRALQVGDLVLMPVTGSQALYGSRRVGAVVRFTATQIVVRAQGANTEERYQRATGKKVGSSLLQLEF